MLKKIVLTGAAGRLGGICRMPLSEMCEELVSTDQADTVDGLAPNETYVKADLGSLDAMVELLQGAEMVVHFGALGDEGPWETILHSNILGAYNIWEAAYRNGLRRVVYASSIHAVGMHPKTAHITVDTPHRPDTYYGLAKCFAEDLGSLFWDKRGIESVHMRIASASGAVGNARGLGTWLSDRDLIQLVQRSVEAPTTGFTVVYGVSNNDRSPYDNAGAAYLGFRPLDNAEREAEEILAKAAPMDPQNPEDMCIGGPFAVVPLGESGVAMIKARNVKA